MMASTFLSKSTTLASANTTASQIDDAPTNKVLNSALRGHVTNVIIEKIAFPFLEILFAQQQVFCLCLGLNDSEALISLPDRAGRNRNHLHSTKRSNDEGVHRRPMAKCIEERDASHETA